MIWKLKNVTQETNHRFLNFFTYTYEVNKQGQVSDYPYFVASRHKKEDLNAVTRSYKRPDGVLMMVIKEGDEPSLLMIEQFRPPMNTTILEVPAGLLEESDLNELSAAKRECVEEAGVELVDVELLCPASPTSAGLSDELVSVVIGKAGKLTSTALERFEDIKARFVPLTDLRAILADPNIVIALNVRLLVLYVLARYGL